MTPSEIIARIDALVRPAVSKLPPDIFIPLYSKGRKFFLERFFSGVPSHRIKLPQTQKVRLWDIEFGTDLFNAAGIFKDGRGYYVAAFQGAGAWLAGTVTPSPRKGNQKQNVLHPFVPYPGSGSASNWMGLPNPGPEAVAKRFSEINKLPRCPAGISLSADPGDETQEALKNLVQSMEIFEKAGADFIEINESCPNVPGECRCNDECTLEDSQIKRLEYISDNFIKTRKRNVPVIVKFSNDTSKEFLPALLDTLAALKFDGINLGNTSVNYDKYVNDLSENDRKIFQYFKDTYGGGLSGRLLKQNSLGIAAFAANYIGSKNIKQEFHVIRTGGIETYEDISKSHEAGISLNQWFSGYFEVFSKYGHKVYKETLSTI